jgi:TLD
MGGQLGYFGLFLDASYGQGFCSESCTTYHSPMMSTTKEFEVSHLEVWAVGPPPPPPEELVSELWECTRAEFCKKKMNRFVLQGERSSVLDRDNEAKAILAMVGKEQKSDGLREPEPE